tara:strand:+ start:222 stop:560 length:339 start_codon:yes stop_codon:yes gene_type:complete
MTLQHYAEAIKNLAGDKVSFYVEETLDSLKWGSDPALKPTDEAIEAENTRIQNDLPNRRLRADRNKLLAETDWMANSDVTMSDAWKKYRQDLRDIPANTADPANPTWPTKPT